MQYTNKKFTNTRFWSFSTRLTAALGGLLVIAVISLTIYSLNQQSEQRSHAAASTTLSFSQPTVQVNAGSPITVDVTMNPGSNFVSLVTLVIDYDSSAITPDTTKGIVANTQAFPSTLDGPTYNTCNGTQCTMSISLSVGNDPTKAIKAATTVATVNFTPVAQNGTTQLAFDTQTQVFSVAPGDQANENVLSTTTPATVTIGQGSSTSPTPFPSSGPTATQAPNVPGSTLTPVPTGNTTPGPHSTPTPKTTGTPHSTPTPKTSGSPQPTPPLVCKPEAHDKDKDVEKEVEKARQHIDNVAQAINNVVQHTEVAKADKLAAVQSLSSELATADTNIQTAQNNLGIGNNSNGGCVGNFDPNNPTVVNNCNHPAPVSSNPLQTFWNNVTKQFQSLFGGGQ